MVSMAHLQSFDRGSMMTPGALTYSLCWIRDSAFMIHALDKLGFHDQAREKLLDLRGRQNKEGCFISQEGEWDSNGLAIWAMLEHFKLTRDKQFLLDVYPAWRGELNGLNASAGKPSANPVHPPVFCRLESRLNIWVRQTTITGTIFGAWLAYKEPL